MYITTSTSTLYYGSPHNLAEPWPDQLSQQKPFFLCESLAPYVRLLLRGALCNVRAVHKQVCVILFPNTILHFAYHSK